MEHVNYIAMLRRFRRELLVRRPPVRHLLRDRSNPFEMYGEVLFKTRFRFSKETVRDLLRDVGYLLEQDTRGSPLTVTLQLLLTLRFLATDAFYTMNSDTVNVNAATVCRTVGRVVTTINSLRGKLINFPNNDELPAIRNDFAVLSRDNFPGIIGAIDCTHIRITCHDRQRSVTYINRKGFYSINCQIYTADGDRASKAIINGNMCWVAFSLRHSAALTNEQLLQFHDHEITFNYWPTEKRIGQRAKSDHPTAFKALEEQLPESEIDFVELFENDKDVNIPSSMKKFLNPNMGEVVSMPWALPWEKHWDSSVETIKMSQEILKNVSISTREGSRMPSRSSSKRKSAADCSEHMSASAAALFTDSQETRCHIRSSNVQYMLAIISVVDLMTPVQMLLYNPLFVNIHKLKGLPLEFLKENQFKSLYIKYKVPSVDEIQTAEKKLEDTNIEFNEPYAIFTNDIPRVQLLEFIQTGYLLFEIYGVRDLPRCASVFGEEEMDEWLGSKLLHTVVSNCHQDIYPPSTNVLLGVARVDLGDLMIGPRIILETVPVQLPKRSFENGYTGRTNILEVNEFLMRKYQGSPCTNLILNENNTRLKVSVKLLASLTYPLWELQSSLENFHRLFAIINDRLTAMEIINEIYRSNERCLGLYIGVPNYCKGEASRSEIPEEQSLHEEGEKLSLLERNERENVLEEDNDESTENLNYERRRHQYLTGFAVDDFDKVLLFVEGPPAGKLQEIHQMLTEQYTRETNSTVFYNSDLMFQHRLYEDFVPYGGLYTITLKEKIGKKLVHFSAYQEERIPGPTFRALQQFNLLLKVSDLAAACRNHYFPSASDLMSFDAELGVPLRYRIDT